MLPVYVLDHVPVAVARACAEHDAERDTLAVRAEVDALLDRYGYANRAALHARRTLDSIGGMRSRRFSAVYAALRELADVAAPRDDS